MFNDWQKPRLTPLGIIAIITFAIFVVGSIAGVWLHDSTLMRWLSLTPESLRGGEIWRLVTYALLHDGFWHVALNLLAILMIGIPLEREIGGKAMAVIYGLLVLGGGLAFTLTHLTGGGALVGASAAAVGLLTLYCLSYPDRPITLLLFFVLPITVFPRYVLYFTLAMNALGFILEEVAPGHIGGVTGYSAHLGGMLAAWGVYRWCLRSNAASPSHVLNIEPPAWVKKKTVINKATGNTSGGYQLDFSSKPALQREVDRILDKINTHGFGALTASEKKTLDKAKDILGK